MSRSYTLTAGLSGALYFKVTSEAPKERAPDTYIIDASVAKTLFSGRTQADREIVLNHVLDRVDEIKTVNQFQKIIIKMVLCKEFVYKTKKLTRQQKALMDHVLNFVIACHPQGQRQTNLCFAKEFSFDAQVISRSTDYMTDSLALNEVTSFIKKKYFDKRFARLGIALGAQDFLEKFFRILNQVLSIFIKNKAAEKFLMLYGTFFEFDVRAMWLELCGLLINAVTLNADNVWIVGHPISKAYTELSKIYFDSPRALQLAIKQKANEYLHTALMMNYSPNGFSASIPLKTKKDRDLFLEAYDESDAWNLSKEGSKYLTEATRSFATRWQKCKDFFNPRMHEGFRKYALYVFYGMTIVSVVFGSVVSAGVLPAVVGAALGSVALTLKIASVAIGAQMTILGALAIAGSVLSVGLVGMVSKGCRVIVNGLRKQTTSPVAAAGGHISFSAQNSSRASSLTISRNTSNQSVYEVREQASYQQILTALANVVLPEDSPFAGIVQKQYAGSILEQYFAMIIALGNELAHCLQTDAALPAAVTLLLQTWRQNILTEKDKALALIEQDYRAATRATTAGFVNWSTISRLFAAEVAPAQEERRERVAAMKANVRS